jgi:hypothetical protein
MNEDKIKEFIRYANSHGTDCGFCRANGIDVRKCNGDCVEVIMEILK